MIREAVTDADLEAWRRVRIAVLPNERTGSVEEIRATASPEQRLLLAEVDGDVVGAGGVNRSDLGGASLFPRVLPPFRRRGIGTGLLRALAAHAEFLGFSEAGASVEDEGSLAFARRFGFRETGRQVEQVRAIRASEPRPRVLDGLTIVSLAKRPELRLRAFHELALEASAERENPFAELRGAVTNGVRYVRVQPLLLAIVAIDFFGGMSTEAMDRLREAHFIREIGLPRVGSLDPVVWFGLFGVGGLVIGFVASQYLVRRFERDDPPSLARWLAVITAAQGVALALFALSGTLGFALAALWLYGLTRALDYPLYMTWLNQNIGDSSVRATVISIAGQSNAIGQAGGGPVLGVVGNVFGIRAALLAGAAVIAPALALYARAIRHGGLEPELDQLPEPVEA